MTQLEPIPAAPRGVEANGINAIDESEHRGSPRELFWPWFAANVSVFGISYAAFILYAGVSFWQAVIVGVIGIVFSFLLCGLVSIAGKRGNAPTMTLSRAAFGTEGNRLPSLISWVLTVGWETALTALAVLATSTVFDALGASGGTGTKIVALVVVAALIVIGGILGFDFIMKLQKWITIVTGVLTVVFVIVVAHRIDWAAVNALPTGSLGQFIGALVLVMTGFGLGWVNAAADYSRYLPRTASTRGVVGWTTLGGSVAPILLVVFGLLLVGSDPVLLNGSDTAPPIGNDPIGALVSTVPTWFLVPFGVVAILGLIGGAVLDIYSSGLALLSVGLKAPRYVAAGIDGVLMIVGAIYVVFIADNFIGPFQGFLITLGVPIAVWCGIFLADLQLRKESYVVDELFSRRGRYGTVTVSAVVLVVVGTAVGWGLVQQDVPGFKWQGYFLDIIGGKAGTFGFANIGVLIALALGYVGTLVLRRDAVRRQEALPVSGAAKTLS